MSKYDEDNDSDIEEVYSTVPPVKKVDPVDDLLREVFDSGKISREADEGDVEVIEVKKKNGEVINEGEEEDDPEEEDDDPEEEEPDDPDPDLEEEEEDDNEGKEDEKENPLDEGEEEDADDDDDDDDDEEEEEADLARIRKAHSDCLITPFNMKEEMEEGHFDDEGTYHWKKEKIVQDIWLENIDWVKVKNGEGTEGKLVSDDTVDSTESFDCVAIYKKILQFMKPKDTIASAIRRLGGNKTLSTAEKWKRKKAGESTNEDTAGLQKVTDLTELANLILNKTGNMDVYEETYEKIIEKISKPSEKLKSVTETCRAPELDMYADDFGDKEKARLEGETVAKKQKLSQQTSDNEPTSSSDISSTTSSTCQKSFSIGETIDGCDSAEVDVIEKSNSSP